MRGKVGWERKMRLLTEKGGRNPGGPCRLSLNGQMGGLGPPMIEAGQARAICLKPDSGLDMPQPRPALDMPQPGPARPMNTPMKNAKQANDQIMNVDKCNKREAI